MVKDFKELKLNQMSQRLKALRENDVVSRPQLGWIRFIREALGMSSKALAKRLEISAPSMSITEKDELNESITIKRLRNVADSLNCDLVYYFLPRQEIKDMIRERAEHLAKEKIMQMQMNMEYEDQAVREEFIRDLVEKEVRRLMNSKKLWDE